jgi:hypothetical protein
VDAPLRRLRLLLLELLPLPRMRVAGLPIERLLQLLRASAGGAHQRSRLDQLRGRGRSTLLRRGKGARRFFQAAQLLRAGRLTLGQLGARSGCLLLELGDAPLERGAALLGLRGALLGAGCALLRGRYALFGASGALCGCGLRGERLVAGLLELHLTLGMADQPLLGIGQRAGKLLSLGVLRAAIIGARWTAGGRTS